MERSFTRHGQKLVQLFEPIAQEGKVIDFQETMQSFTFETICDIAFGIETGAVSLDVCILSRKFE